MSNLWSLVQQAEHRRQWVAALRSGEFAQGRNALRDGDSYCCLGVACELAARANVIRPGRRAVPRPGVPRSDMVYGYGSVGNTGYLPIEVMDWLGVLSNTAPLTDPPEGIPHLAAANDQGMSFHEIADLIEQGKIRVDRGEQVS
jgi:hypothetical protein